MAILKMWAAWYCYSKFWIIQIQDENNKKNPSTGNTRDVEIEVPLKYLSNFWRTIEISLTNFKINLILPWSAYCVISCAIEATNFAITNIIV